MSDVFDLLLSMGDFMAFKEVMLAYRKETQTVRPWDVNHVNLGWRLGTTVPILAPHGVRNSASCLSAIGNDKQAAASSDSR